MDYQTATWLHNDLGWRVYRIRSADDLLNPLAFMYYGAAYLIWLSTYEGRERTHEFIIQASKSEYFGDRTTLVKVSKCLFSIERSKEGRRQGGSCSILEQLRRNPYYTSCSCRQDMMPLCSWFLICFSFKFSWVLNQYH